jgi:hypothetical protein
LGGAPWTYDAADLEILVAGEIVVPALFPAVDHVALGAFGDFEGVPEKLGKTFAAFDGVFPFDATEIGVDKEARAGMAQSLQRLVRGDGGNGGVLAAGDANSSDRAPKQGVFYFIW